ncbi:CCA tRNA nucleotidyltransferase [Entomospira culicis]|uniref:Polynucleotide adenylyltransferase n=1 Tax=Entomospira culicis TaxID=2719989 RepID=A0A968KU50_9SPIO|nr:polynucleotide adenylyltransferase [Entomospira culicis]NIZ18580.1 polynucleotide adenylyltransferase [Entomospira culicis]NIZ68795.1 polynucleotide adenylyltransferase [Entomospira culicis]WDI37391.1 polynucleotide adenylyltransferase [Entomospira culicis]WDI39020.1 polynucleotide adenylyltransferase [Entomospira culicis]
MLPSQPFAKFQETLHAIAQKLADHGYQCYVVGGAVRDHFLEKESLDIDLATDASPKEVSKIFRHTIPTGIAHGTVTILYHNIPFEITTFRTDGKYEDARHPESVQFVQSIDEDLKRRDFTINAIAYHILDGEFYDPLGGIDAIQNKEITAIGVPAERFQEDLLRILRGVRFLAELKGFVLDEATAIAMHQHAPGLHKISKERITKEMKKLLTGAQASYALEVAYNLGIWDGLFDELAFYHQKLILPEQTLWQTLLRAIDYTPQSMLHLRIAILLSALGELESASEAYQVIYRSAKLAEELLVRYKVSNALKQKVSHLIRYQELILLDLWSDADIRRWLSQVKIEHVEEIVLLNKALYQACGRAVYELEEFYQRVKNIIAQDPPITIQQLAINGAELIEVGVPAGPRVGEFLQQLLELVLDDPEFNTKNNLLHATKFFMSI